MFTNRISAHFRETEQKVRTRKGVGNRPSKSRAPAIPSGFAVVPSMLLPATCGSITLEHLYRAAYEQAQRDARRRLVELLRSRMIG